MSRLEAIQARLAGWESHPRVGAGLAGADRFVTWVSSRDYRGSNPAVASAHGPMRTSALAMLAVTLLTLLFGVAVPVESAAIARGSVAVLTKRKTVQHLEGGIVKRILVQEGEVVRQGQPLMEISDVAPKANREIVQSGLWVERASEARLIGLQHNAQTIEFPEAMEQAAKERPELEKTIQAQIELFITQRDAQDGKLKSLRQRINQTREEIVGLQAQVKSAEGQLAYIADEIDAVKTLLKKELATKTRLYALQRTQEELRGNRGQYSAQIAKAEQAITETQMEVINLENEFSTKIAEELHEVQARIHDYEEKLRAADDVVERTVITAPSEGVVTGLKSHTVGGVIAPGAPIMDIVPQSDKLVLEVRVQPTDIDVVEPGLESRVVFTAYKSRRMPLLTGKVTQVSADTFNEQQGLQNVSYYTARVEVDGKELASLDSKLKLYPGMPADVYIRTGERSFLAYLFAPITDSLRKAFKEE